MRPRLPTAVTTRELAEATSSQWHKHSRRSAWPGCNYYGYSSSVSANSKLTIATHALAWMTLNEQAGAELTTSDQIAKSVNTNPVVIRRLMSQMTKAGLISSRRGARAGWRLARKPEEITLHAIDAALGHEATFALHRNEPSAICPIARGIRPALAPVYARVEDAIRHELERTSLAEVLQNAVDARNI